MFFKVAILALGLVSSGHCAPAEITQTAARSANGGVDAAISLSQQLGEHARATVGASGNTLGGPVTTGAKLEAGKNGFGVAIEKADTHGVTGSLTKSAHGTLPLGPNNALTGTVFDSKISPAGGPGFTKQGGSLAWENVNGVGASIAKERIPGFSNTLKTSGHATILQNNNHKVEARVFDKRTSFASGLPPAHSTGVSMDWEQFRSKVVRLGLIRSSTGVKVNMDVMVDLLSSYDGNTYVGANVGGSQYLSGPMAGQNDYHVGVKMKHNF